MIDTRIDVYCTDKNKNVDGYIINVNRGKFLEVAINTVKVKMAFEAKHAHYVGNMAGYEFIVKDRDLPDEQREYARKR
jgi:hypothetical protein|tara:strand:+ start:1757 stop:1990 length:234 start_codon:yes stop_codon:yes gene_type:complete